MRRASVFVAELAAAVFMLSIAAYYSIVTRAGVIDPDIYWHIRVGDWIVAHHGVPRLGILSQRGDLPFTAYSWLFDVLVSGVHRLTACREFPVR